MADFAYSPDFKYAVKKDYAVLISKFENGTEQRRLKRSMPDVTYELKFGARTKTELDAVKSFYDTKYGSLTAFTIDLDGETVTVCFVPGSFAFSLIAYQMYDYSFHVYKVSA